MENCPEFVRSVLILLHGKLSNLYLGLMCESNKCKNIDSCFHITTNMHKVLSKESNGETWSSVVSPVLSTVDAEASSAQLP